MIHPNTELRVVNELIGYGVFATEFVPKGTLVYVQDALEVRLHPGDPRIIDPALFPLIERYSYSDSSGNRIISWDLAKYVNHCCDANTLSSGYGFEIAVRDIVPGEEITDDYGLFLFDQREEMVCLCAARNCRGRLRVKDFDSCVAQWDMKVRAAVDLFPYCSQPLLRLLDRTTIRALNGYIRGTRRYRSVQTVRPCSRSKRRNSALASASEPGAAAVGALAL